MERQNTHKCRKLRRSQTDAELKLWYMLCNRRLAGAKFRRQFSIDKYILDFYCPEYKIGIEADGGQHYEDKGIERDKVRAKKLSEYGVKILRYSDLDILTNIEGVCEKIEGVIENERLAKTPHPAPLP